MAESREDSYCTALRCLFYYIYYYILWCICHQLIVIFSNEGRTQKRNWPLLFYIHDVALSKVFFTWKWYAKPMMQLSCCYTQRRHPKIVLSCWRFHIYFYIVLYCERLDWSQQWLIVVFDAAHIVPSAVKINHFHDWSHPLPIIALWCCLPTLFWISESRRAKYHPL